MIAWMVSLWATPIVRRLIAAAAAMLAILWFMRVYGNRQYQQGESAGIRIMAGQMEKAFRSEMEKKEKLIAAEKAGLAQTADMLRHKLEALSAERNRLRMELEEQSRKTDDYRKKAEVIAASVPDDFLWDAIREVSGRLTAADGR